LSLIITNPYCVEEVVPNKPKNDFKPKKGEKWFEAAHRMWYEEKIMPSRTIRVKIELEKIHEILITHAANEEKIGDATVAQNKDETWSVELPVVADDGFTTHEIVEYSKKEFDDIMMQEVRTSHKIDITGGNQKIEYVLHNNDDDDDDGPQPLAYILVISTGKFK